MSTYFQNVIFTVEHSDIEPDDEVFVFLRGSGKYYKVPLTTDSRTFPKWSSREYRLRVPLKYYYCMRDRHLKFHMEDVGDRTLAPGADGHIQTHDKWAKKEQLCKVIGHEARVVVQDDAKKMQDSHLQLSGWSGDQQNYVEPDSLTQKIRNTVEETMRKEKIDLKSEMLELLNFCASTVEKFTFVDKVKKIERDLNTLCQEVREYRDAGKQNEDNWHQLFAQLQSALDDHTGQIHRNQADKSNKQSKNDLQQDVKELKTDISAMRSELHCLYTTIGDHDKRMGAMPKELETNIFCRSLGERTSRQLREQQSQVSEMASGVDDTMLHHDLDNIRDVVLRKLQEAASNSSAQHPRTSIESGMAGQQANNSHYKSPSPAGDGCKLS